MLKHGSWGLGSALVDILVHESDDFVRRIGVEKGGMTLVEMPELETILNQVSTPRPSRCRADRHAIRRWALDSWTGLPALLENGETTPLVSFLNMHWSSGGWNPF